MTIIKQTGVQSSGHMKNLRGYINDDRKVILRDSLNMDGSAAVDMPSHMRIGRAKRTSLRCPSQRTMRSRTWYLPLR